MLLGKTQTSSIEISCARAPHSAKIIGSLRDLERYQKQMLKSTPKSVNSPCKIQFRQNMHQECQNKRKCERNLEPKTRKKAHATMPERRCKKKQKQTRQDKFTVPRTSSITWFPERGDLKAVPDRLSQPIDLVGLAEFRFF